jgi:hypothetical protein
VRDLTTLQTVLDRAEVDAAVSALRPDYRALLLAVDGIEPGPGDDESEQLLQQAETRPSALAERAVEELPHVAGARRGARSSPPARPPRCSSSTPWRRSATTRWPPPATTWSRSLHRLGPDVRVARRLLDGP